MNTLQKLTKYKADFKRWLKADSNNDPLCVKPDASELLCKLPQQFIRQVEQDAKEELAVESK